MAVAITPSGAAAAFPLTSTPAKPEPQPEEALIAKVMSYADRTVWVTHPQPDTIVLKAPILNEVLEVPDQSGKTAKEIYAQLDEEISHHLTWPAAEPVQKVKLIAHEKPNRTALYRIPCGPHHSAYLRLARTPGPDFGSWRVELEFSPANVGPAGLDAIEEGLEIVAGFLNFDRLLSACQVARLDVAIDCIGLRPLDLICHIPKPGKRNIYVGDDAGVETIYLHQRKAPATNPKPAGWNTLGTLRATVYERRAQFLQLGWLPPFGPCPVTRIEVRKRWNNKRPWFSDLGGIENMFAGRRFAYAAEVPVKPSNAWREFCLLVFAQGIERTTYEPLRGQHIGMAKRYENCVGDLVDESSWIGWGLGLEICGLAEWIARAKKGL